MHVPAPVEVRPAHELHIASEKRGQPPVVGKQIHVVAIADMLADLLLARRAEAFGVLDELVHILDLRTLVARSRHLGPRLNRCGSCRRHPCRRHSWCRPAAPCTWPMLPW